MAQPTIKGIFVNSHVKLLKKAKGDEGYKKLTECFGREPNFRNIEDVLVSDEVKLLECSVRIREGEALAEQNVAFESGRLHLTDFKKTPLGKMLFATFSSPRMILQSTYIAEHVFKGISFLTHDFGESNIQIIMRGGIYPLAHFEGFFHEWVAQLGYIPTVIAKQLGPEEYQYDITWKK